MSVGKMEKPSHCGWRVEPFICDKGMQISRTDCARPPGFDVKAESDVLGNALYRLPRSDLDQMIDTVGQGRGRRH